MRIVAGVTNTRSMSTPARTPSALSKDPPGIVTSRKTTTGHTMLHGSSNSHHGEEKIMAEKKEPFGGKRAAPFGKKGEEKKEEAKKAPAKKTAAKKK
jgi:hypothetical protein